MKRPAAAVVDESSRVVAVGNGEDYDYEHICALAEGGYGIVTKARHRATGRIVAIKVLVPGEYDYDHDDRAEDILREVQLRVEEDMLREARLLAACAGVPFVVSFHELIRYPGCPELHPVMEYVDLSIAKFLRLEQDGGRIPEPTVRAVMRQLLTAAEGMHARSIIHRDIKPQNVLVAEDLRVVKLCDFGLAMSTASDGPPFEPAGTPGYRAPEVLLVLPEYDGRVDTWSLGCVMAEVLTGRRLFETHYYGDEDQDLLTILGVPDEEACTGFLDTPFATKRRKGLMNLQQELNPNVLRERIPETVLSEQGFQVLKGLLTCNPDNRLTAAAALKLPYFNCVDATELPIKKKEAAPTLPLRKKTKKRLKVPAPKRQKLQCL